MHLSIGEVASLTGLPVKTIRFYSDEGLLPATTRTSGGHRRYGREHLARLELIRSLRALDVDLPTIGALLDDRRELSEVLAAQREVVATQLRRLRRREAILRVVADDPSLELVLRLPALSRLEDVERSHLLEDFWGRVLDDTHGDPRTQAQFRSVMVPDLPEDADAAIVADFLELADLVTDEQFVAASRHSATWLFEAAGGPVDLAAVMGGTRRAAELADAARERGDDVPGEAVDAFAGAYAEALGRPDGPDFRRWLLDQHERATDPRFPRFWELVGRLGGVAPDPEMQRLGRTMAALLEALGRDVDAGRKH